MGQCRSREIQEQQRRDLDIQRDLNHEKIHSYLKMPLTLLLMGTSGSGKSTISKGLRVLHGSPLTIERSQYVQLIHDQCIAEMKLALESFEWLQDLRNGNILDDDLMNLVFGYIREFEYEYFNDLFQVKIPMDIQLQIYQHCTLWWMPYTDIPNLSEQGVEAANTIQSLHHTKYCLSDKIVAALKILWDEPAIRKMYELRNITGIEDSSAHFWNKLDEIADSDYTLFPKDRILVRQRTTGHIEFECKIKQWNFRSIRCIDVGGQNSEPRKWIHCFDSVTAIIFVASLSCYDEMVYFDNGSIVNAMTHQLQYFDFIVNNQWLNSQSSMILFLNKMDLFNTKISKVPLTKCESFSRYDGEPHSSVDTIKYIRKAFTSLNENGHQRNIFTHVTCATSLDNIHKVFADVFRIVNPTSYVKEDPFDYEDESMYRQETSGSLYPEMADLIRDSFKTQSQIVRRTF